MSKILGRCAGALAAATLAATLSAPASAALVRYDIVEGVLGGQNYDGSFVFDDAAPVGVNFDGFPLYELLSFTFTHGGTVYTPDLTDFVASSYGWVSPTDGSEQGLDAQFSDFLFMPGWGGALAIAGSAASLAFDDGRLPDVVDISYRLVDSTSVPEPASLALALTALLGMGAALRRTPRR